MHVFKNFRNNQIKKSLFTLNATKPTVKFTSNKNSFSTMANSLNLKTMPAVAPDDPEFGNIKEIKKTSFYEWMYKKHEELGPIFSFWINKDQVCSIAHPLYFKPIANLNTRSNVYFKFLETLFGNNNLNNTSGFEWHERNRVYVHPNFKQDNVLKLHKEAIQDTITKSFEEWTGYAENNEVFSLQKSFSRMVMVVMFRVLFGLKDLSKYDLDEIFVYLSYSSANVGDQTKKNQEIELEKFMWVRNVIRDLCKEYYKMRDADPEGPKCCYLDFVREKNPDFEYVFVEAVTMFFSGIHTSTTLATLTTYHLGANPDCQTKLQQNLDEAYDEKLCFELEKIRKIRYLRNCLRETTRATPLVNFTTRTDFEKDIVAEDGMVIPKGMEIIIFMSHVFENPDFWKDVEKYNPDRYSEVRGDGAIPFLFLPFGFAGGRICPGKYLAELEIGTAIASLFKNFTVKLHDHQPLKIRRLTANSVVNEIYATLEKRI